MKCSKKDIAVNAGFGLALAILIFIGWLSFRNMTAMAGFDRMVERSYAVMLELDGLLSSVKDVDKAEHNFLITGEEKDLEQYGAALTRIDRHLAALKSLTANHPPQRDRIDGIERLIGMKVAEVREIIPRRKKEGFPAAFRLEMTQRHEQLMDEIRRQSAEAQDAVMQHLSMRKASKEASARNTIIAFFAGTTLSIALLISTFLLLRREITERRRTEKALRFSEARYRALYRDNPTMIVTLDTNFTMLAVNPICACLLGYLIEELEGESVLKLFHEDDRPAVAEQLRNCLENPEQVHRWQFRKVRKDGSLLWVEETAQAVYDLNGTLNMLVVCQDITERKRAEDALRKSEKKFLKIFHAAPALVGITTLAEGRFVDVNETCARILGYQREELIGRTSLELGIWNSQADRDRIVRVLEEHGKVRDLEITFRGKAGETHTGVLSAEFIDLDGDRYVLSLLNDITERKRMEEEIGKLNTDLATRAAELEGTNRELEAFNYTVAHDLRKPLTVINGYCQAIRELCSDKLDAQCAGYLQEAYEGTWRMNRLIEALLDFARLAHVDLHRAAVDLPSLAREVATELKLAEPGRRVTFRIAEGMTADGDAKLLRVVLDNLLGNAWKYTGSREEAIIEFGMAEIDGQPAWFVRDNGPGFAMADADKLFLPFQRLPGAEEYRGFGIGLATVERIVRRHGGRVWAEGEPDNGATFWFTLPKES